MSALNIPAQTGRPCHHGRLAWMHKEAAKSINAGVKRSSHAEAWEALRVLAVALHAAVRAVARSLSEGQGMNQRLDTAAPG